MATKSEIITTARNYLRDFKKPFQQSFVPMGKSYDLGKPNVEADSLYVAYVPQGGSSASVLLTSQYELDARNGLVRLVPQLSSGDTLMVEGYYYEWLLPEDMDFYADMAINLNTHNLKVPLANMAPAVADVIGIHTLVQALWGLLSEYSRDIDVITSESVHIQASQRYRMVSSLLDYWSAEYNRRAQALNIGLERLEVVNLRRVSRTTNRLVPLYKQREVGDYGPIERIWPDIDDGLINIEEEPDDTRQEVYLDGEPPPGYLSTGQY
jgi:hypothetical protein